MVWIISRPNASAVIILTDVTFTFGRAIGNSALCFPEDKSISRAHATVRAESSSYDMQQPLTRPRLLLTDTSKFGTFVEGVKCTPQQPVELYHGSSVVFGQRVSAPVLVHWFPLLIATSRVEKVQRDFLINSARVLGAHIVSQNEVFCDRSHIMQCSAINLALSNFAPSPLTNTVVNTIPSSYQRVQLPTFDTKTALYESPLGHYVSLTPAVPKQFSSQPDLYRSHVTSAFLPSNAAAASQSGSAGTVAEPIWNLLWCTMSTAIATEKMIAALVRSVPVITPSFFTAWIKQCRQPSAASQSQPTQASITSDCTHPNLNEFRPPLPPNIAVDLRCLHQRFNMFADIVFICLTSDTSERLTWRELAEVAGGHVICVNHTSASSVAQVAATLVECARKQLPVQRKFYCFLQPSDDALDTLIKQTLESKKWGLLCDSTLIGNAILVSSVSELKLSLFDPISLSFRPYSATEAVPSQGHVEPASQPLMSSIVDFQSPSPKPSGGSANAVSTSTSSSTLTSISSLNNAIPRTLSSVTSSVPSTAKAVVNAISSEAAAVSKSDSIRSKLSLVPVANPPKHSDPAPVSVKPELINVDFADAGGSSNHDSAQVGLVTKSLVRKREDARPSAVNSVNGGLDNFKKFRKGAAQPSSPARRAPVALLQLNGGAGLRSRREADWALESAALDSQSREREEFLMEESKRSTDQRELDSLFFGDGEAPRAVASRGKLKDELDELDEPEVRAPPRVRRKADTLINPSINIASRVAESVVDEMDVEPVAVAKKPVVVRTAAQRRKI